MRSANRSHHCTFKGKRQSSLRQLALREKLLEDERGIAAGDGVMAGGPMWTGWSSVGVLSGAAEAEKELCFSLHLVRPEKQLCANCICHEMILLVMMKQLSPVSSTKMCLRILFASLSKPVFVSSLPSESEAGRHRGSF